MSEKAILDTQPSKPSDVCYTAVDNQNISKATRNAKRHVAINIHKDLEEKDMT